MFDLPDKLKRLPYGFDAQQDFVPLLCKTDEYCMAIAKL